MKLFRIFAIVAMAIVSSINAQAGVVLFSNMGASGLEETDGGESFDIGSSARAASGFRTGSTEQALGRISIVADTVTSGNYAVSIFLDNGFGEPGSLVFTSDSLFLSGLNKGVKTFDFTGTTLAANTSYWILPESGVRWYRESLDDEPIAYNNSGFTYLGAMTKESGSWVATLDNFTVALAIPEPGLTSLLCLSGIALIRRRMKK